MSSTTSSDDDSLTRRLGQRLAALRADAGLSLAELAERSGVSRSMISLIERGESSPTAVVLDRLATALGVTLASLFERDEEAPGGPLLRLAEQPVWRDPQSGYRRRQVSPMRVGSPLQLVSVDFPAGATVAYETAERPGPVHQLVWVLQGEMQVGVGDATHELARGDCLAMTLDRPIRFHNPGSRLARYAVVLARPGGTRA